VVLGLLGACATSTATDAGPKLAFFDRVQTAARSATLTRYRIGNKTYYYVLAPCCDQFNRLYDERGDYVCAPDGGFHGGGDRRCGTLRFDRSSGVVVPNPFPGP